MYTQQSNVLAAALSLPAGQQQNQALLQVFANCIQGLRTNGPVSINSAAGSRAPAAGVINSPPGLGSVTNPGVTNNALLEYLYGAANRPVNQYPSNVWNVNAYNNPSTNNNYFSTNLSNNTTNQGGNTANFFGGDSFYGDNYLTTNSFSNPQNFNLFNNSDYYNYNNYNTSVNNSVNNNNVSNWYNNQYTDNSYNDFTTTLETTQNSYNQTVNNFEGDSYFDNTVNQGDVINQSTVINQGDVINEGSTFLTEEKTFITNADTTVNIAQFITNLVVNIVFGGGGGPGVGGGKLPAADFTGDAAKITVPVPKYKFDDETCSIVPDDPPTEDVVVDFKPTGKVALKPG